MGPVRYFTPGEAASEVARLKPLLAALRDAHHAYRFAFDQVEDLRTMAGPDVANPTHPDHTEFARWDTEAREAERRVAAIVSEIRAIGAEVKDPLLGLVDFYAKRGEETVLLCYRDDEDTIGWWHPLTTGYTGRRPLSEF